MTELSAQPERRPWYKWHLTTWLSLLAVGAALAYSQHEFWGGVRTGGRWTWTTLNYQGWPVIARRQEVVSTLHPHPTNPRYVPTFTKEIETYWVYGGLALNIAFSMLLLTSTGLVVERRQRNPRWQFSLSSLFISTAVIGFLLIFFQHQTSIYIWLSHYTDAPTQAFRSLQTTPKYLLAPLVCGMFCFLYLLCNFILLITSGAIRKIASLYAIPNK